MSKILVVDDDPVTLDFVQGVLEAAGHEVITQERAYSATLCIRREAPDIVLLDLELPGANGDEIVDLLVRDFEPGERPRVVLYSGTDQAELDAIAKRAGADGSLQKTNDPSALVAEIARFSQR